MAQELPTAEQEALVYEAIREIAVRCDGAQSLDGQGFNGIDTKFGRRIASVPHTTWTPEVQLEANKIILKYRQQVLAWTDGRIDVGTLDVVKAAQDNGTNYAGRSHALGFEKRAKHLEARQIGVVDGRLGIKWANGDPDFDAFLKLVRNLPGRTWDGGRRINVVDVSPLVETFIDDFDFSVTERAQALLANPPVAEVHYDITLDGQKVVIAVGYNPALVDELRQLPGRAWDGANKVNRADAHPAVLALAGKWNLAVHPDAVAACERAQEALRSLKADQLAQQDVDTVLAAVSSCGKPEDLPAVFVDMLRGVLND